MLRFIVFLVLTTLACGTPPTKRTYLNKRHIERIVGGTHATIEAYPYYASLILNDGTGNFLCGGSIITPNVILTAAHCMPGISVIDVRVGSNKLFTGGLVIKAFNYTTHPNYNPDTYDYDIALVQLMNHSLPINNRTIKPVNLAAPGIRLPNRTPVVITGYGAISEDGPTATVLMKATVYIVDNQNCSQSYGTITPRMMCAGVPRGGIDSCQGDSGGPLVTVNNTQVGIVSFGIGCGRPGIPGVYTNVSALRPWIQDHIRSC